MKGHVERGAGNPNVEETQMQHPVDRRAVLNSLSIAAGVAVAASAAPSIVGGAAAQQAPAAAAPTPPAAYGAPISADTAKKAMAAAEAEARKNNWAVAIAIVDTTGSLSS